MTKIILSFVSIILSLSIITYTNADNLEQKLYKQVSITNKKIEKDYGKITTAKLRDQFIMYRYTKDITFLNELKSALKISIQNLNKKSILSKNEIKKLNFYNNIYYRTVLLLDYNIK